PERAPDQRQRWRADLARALGIRDAARLSGDLDHRWSPPRLGTPIGPRRRRADEGSQLLGGQRVHAGRAIARHHRDRRAAGWQFRLEPDAPPPPEGRTPVWLTPPTR